MSGRGSAVMVWMAAAQCDTTADAITTAVVVVAVAAFAAFGLWLVTKR